MSDFSAIIDQFLDQKRFQFWIVFTTASILLFSSLNKGGLSGYDDAFYAHYGKQMILTGDWWSLFLNGHHIFEFPPMFPWMEALSMKIFGITDFAAKVPAALCGLFGLTMSMARECANKGITVNSVAPGFIRTEMVEAVPEEVLRPNWWSFRPLPWPACPREPPWRPPRPCR